MHRLLLKYVSVVLPVMVVAQSSTWDIVQGEIFATNCVICHDHGTYFTEQSVL